MTFGDIYRQLFNYGTAVSPRGQKTLEMLNFQYTLPPYLRICLLPSRNINEDYIKHELQWYLRGDTRDISIAAKAKIWQDCITNGELNSNYGQYIFTNGGIRFVVDQLMLDRDSRRAAIPILAQKHCYTTNKDVPCTISINFRIRGSSLQCTVHMRSQDAVFGMCNDVPFFSLVHEMVLMYLLERYEDLELGPLTVFADSFHVYERHFDLLSRMVEEVEPRGGDTVIPRLSGVTEVESLLSSVFNESYPFTRWLRATD